MEIGAAYSRCRASCANRASDCGKNCATRQKVICPAGAVASCVGRLNKVKLTHILLGDGSLAEEISEYSLLARTFLRAVSAEFLDPRRPGQIDVAVTDPTLLKLGVTAAVGSPEVRRTLVTAWAGSNYRSIVSDSAHVSPSSRIGAGCAIGPSAVLSSSVVLAEHVVINIGATVSHGTAVEEYATISPGANVGGRCLIGPGTFLGIGSVVNSGVVTAPGTVLGAGSVLLRDTETNGIYAGSPARLIRICEGWLSEF
ncbi:hypothetical protein E3T51_14210 [Cryobacterium serini]|uniref:Acetyltransferase n=1 Tax=Cryobacterium serini TaxID=1259201 RepID=A0A4R9BMJ5_9MICO|nr:hypothetical protein E3T51_14210 [Cryobacterium serini]